MGVNVGGPSLWGSTQCVSSNRLGFVGSGAIARAIGSGGLQIRWYWTSLVGVTAIWFGGAMGTDLHRGVVGGAMGTDLHRGVVGGAMGSSNGFEQWARVVDLLHNI